MSTESKHVTKHIPARTYIVVFVALAVVTAIEVFLTGSLPAGIKVVVLLGLAAIKALLVMMFFMHLKYDTKTYSLFIVFSLLMAVLLAAVVLIAAANA